MSYITKIALVRSIDENLSQVGRKAETSCGTVDVSELVLAIVDASAHADHSATQWLDAARTGYGIGIRGDMLMPRIPDGKDAKGKEKTKKNPTLDKVLFESIKQAIIAGISVNRPLTVYLTMPRPDATGAEILAKKASAHTWTAFQVANCPKTYMAEQVDDAFDHWRTVYNGWASGTYMGRLVNHLLNIEFPNRRAEARAAKLAEKEAVEDAAAEMEAAKGAPLLDRMVLALQEFNASVLALKGADGQGLRGVIEAQNAGIELLVRIGQMK